MTVCVAALGDNGKSVVVAADHMITAGDTTFERTERAKIDRIAPGVVVLWAGPSNLPEVILNHYFTAPEADGVAAWAEAVRRAYEGARLERAEHEILRSVGLTLREFWANQATYDTTIALALAENIRNYRLGVEMIVAGVDRDRASLFFVGDPGHVEAFNTSGYVAIGSGANHAISSLIQNEQHPAHGYLRTLYAVYEAKRRAETAPGVGSETTIMSAQVGGDGFAQFAPGSPARVLLDRQWNQRVDSERRSRDMLELELRAALTDLFHEHEENDHGDPQADSTQGQ